ncbi:hypothetical protein CLIB1444_01S10528 [[Candida] jaroonii]|uniref:Uncharacterized protein n=1 Tax=[Candida] jaroonii TaxID=467808 RepID=A0ACA9Y0X9_9ASCO|nr:hypothetical protein CLIB1444_01S10528 [[Candida] jaroonii]
MSIKESANINVGYPVYATKFINNKTLVVLGGGGEGNNGIPNKITAIKVSFKMDKNHRLQRFREITLPPTEDSPMCIDLVKKDGKEYNVFIGCNQSTQLMKSMNINNNLRKYVFTADEHLQFIDAVQLDDDISADGVGEYPKIIDLSTDSKFGCFMTSSVPSVISFFDPVELQLTSKFSSPDEIKDFNLSPDNKKLAYITSKKLEIVSTDTMEIIHSSTKTEANSIFKNLILTKIKYVNDDEFIITANKKKGVCVLKYKDGKVTKMNEFSNKIKGLVAFDFNTNSGLIAVAGNDFSLTILRLSDLKVLKTFPKLHEFALTSVSFSPNGTKLVTGSASNNVHVFKIPNNYSKGTSVLNTLVNSVFYSLMLIILAIFIQSSYESGDLANYYENSLNFATHYFSSVIELSVSSYELLKEKITKLEGDEKTNEYFTMSDWEETTTESPIIESTWPADDIVSEVSESEMVTDIETTVESTVPEPVEESTAEPVEHVEKELHQPEEASSPEVEDEDKDEEVEVEVAKEQEQQEEEEAAEETEVEQPVEEEAIEEEGAEEEEAEQVEEEEEAVEEEAVEEEAVEEEAIEEEAIEEEEEIAEDEDEDEDEEEDEDEDEEEEEDEDEDEVEEEEEAIEEEVEEVEEEDDEEEDDEGEVEEEEAIEEEAEEGEEAEQVEEEPIAEDEDEDEQEVEEEEGVEEEEVEEEEAEQVEEEEEAVEEDAIEDEGIEEEAIEEATEEKATEQEVPEEGAIGEGATGEEVPEETEVESEEAVEENGDIEVQEEITDEIPIQEVDTGLQIDEPIEISNNETKEDSTYESIAQIEIETGIDGESPEGTVVEETAVEETPEVSEVESEIEIQESEAETTEESKETPPEALEVVEEAIDETVPEIKEEKIPTIENVIPPVSLEQATEKTTETEESIEEKTSESTVSAASQEPESSNTEIPELIIEITKVIERNEPEITTTSTTKASPKPKSKPKKKKVKKVKKVKPPVHDEL